jgi:Spy/CpxP family protein refolding chaperone
MKRIVFMVAISLMASLSFAQVQRQKKEVIKTDSAAAGTVQKETAGPNKREMMKELNLSKEQRSKLKEFRQSAQAKKAAIENDDKLSATEKEDKMKEVKKEQLKNTMSVLSPEQKMKLLKMRKDKKGAPMEEMDNQ